MVLGTIHHPTQDETQVPQVVMAMLKNVHLYFVNVTQAVEQDGDFWYWKLSLYGLDLMRLLVNSSAVGFSYAETFTEPDIEQIPQLLMLEEINEEIHHLLVHPDYPVDWDAVLRCDYLHDKTIDVGQFERGIARLIVRIQDTYYISSGNRVYPPIQFAKRGISA